MRAALLSLSLLVACAGAPRRSVEPAAVPSVEVRFLERASRDAPWTGLGDAARVAELRGLLDNEPAGFALALYRLAWELAPPTDAAALGGPVLFVAIEQGGNHAELGLSVDGRDYPKLPYLRLAADRETFRGTLLHETGHALHALLAAGAAGTGDAPGIAPIPHSTAAVTDRRTAFNEGFAIHLEAIHGHCAVDRASRDFYDHAALRHGPTGDRASEFYFPVKDLMTYAQTFARYQAVRDGLYGFETAARGDYLRVQLDPARDLRTLRDPGSLLASEGFVASVIFHAVAREACEGGLMELVPRYRAVFAALRDAETKTGPLDAAPLLDLVAALGAPAVDAFLDLSRGVTVDPEAASIWARLYDAAIAVDLEARDALHAELERRRARWREEVRADARVLARRVGPVVVVEAKERPVGIALFGEPQPLRFDANAAGAPLLALVPGWTDVDVAAFLAEREQRPFTSLADLATRLAGSVRVAALTAPTD